MSGKLKNGLLAVLLCAGLAGCSSGPGGAVDAAAEAYTKLALALGEHDDAYVGFYVGPNEWLAAAKVAQTPLGEIRESARKLHEELAALDPPEDSMERQRVHALNQMLTAMVARTEILENPTALSFDEETRRLYDVVLPVRDKDYFRARFDRLNAVLPGDAPLAQKLAGLQEVQIGVPPEHLEAVFEAAVAECRRRTLEHIELPADEGVTVEYVSGVPFGGRLVYRGDGQSVLQVNRDVPLTFDAVVNLACHEGYPGHHVQSVLLDKHLYQDRGWIEYTLAPLYSAGSLLSEGAANYGVALMWKGDDLRRFKADVLLPLAGLDPADLGVPSPLPPEVRDEAIRVLKQLQGVGEEVARQYLDGNFDRDTALQWLAVFGLMGSPEAAAGYLGSIEESRSYLINYGYGEQYVTWLVEKDGVADEHAKWTGMAELFKRPLIATKQ